MYIKFIGKAMIKIFKGSKQNALIYFLQKAHKNRAAFKFILISGKYILLMVKEKQMLC